MKKQEENGKNPKEHGIISVVQSPDEGENDAIDVNKSDAENESAGTKKHGIISVVQSPDEAKSKKNE